jgi:alpha-ketoglutarate-dependent taurine dioxygenase
MTAVLAPPPAAAAPFDLDDDAAYRHWRAWKLAHRPADAGAITVDLADPYRLTVAERGALLQHIAQASVAVYRTAVMAEDAALPVALAAQLGLRQLDANWLAEEDGVSRITVAAAPADRPASHDRAGFIPYTNQPIRWHTDGYYHPQERRIQGMLLHCVRPAARGGVNRLLDHELAYVALRDESPALVRALMRPDAMTIPARHDAHGEARAAQPGPVFSVVDGALHMRYTARTRSIDWAPDPLVREAAARLAALLDGELPWVLSLRLTAGMGIVGHNLLHDRSGFDDAPGRPRMLYRARFLDRVASAR